MSTHTQDLPTLLRRLASLMDQVTMALRENEAAPRFSASHADIARKLYKLRRLRETTLGIDMFADPLWDMLLDLIIAHDEGREVSVSSLCIAACVPATTALRYIGVMANEQLIHRVADEQDARRTNVILSDEAALRMRVYLDRVASELGI